MPHPFDTLEREVREELGVDLDETHLSATGLVRTIYGSEICFRCRVTLSFDRLLAIQAGPGTDSEIETLEALDDSPAAVAAFLAAHRADLVQSGRACSAALRPRGIRRRVAQSGRGDDEGRQGAYRFKPTGHFP